MMKKKFLSALLALCMLMTLAPVTVFAAGGNGTSSNPYIVSSAEEFTTALQNATDTGTIYIKLNQDITGDLTVTTGKTVSLNLNGKTLTNSTGDTITVAYGASLFITGKGTVDNETHAKAAIFNNGTVVLSGGTYDRTSETSSSPDVSGGNSWYTICNHGTMTINAGVTVKNTGSFSSMIENGYYNYGSTDHRSGYVAGTNSANPTLTINGGTFTGGLNSVKNDDGGILTINGGSFSNTTQAAVLNWNKATINDGTFTVDAANQNCILNGASAMSASEQDLGQLTINGGSFTSPAGIASVANKFRDVAPSITGGSFSSDVSAFGEAAGYKAVEKSGKYVVVTDTADPVAKIGELGFNTLVNAVAAAADGETIVLQKYTSGAGIGTFKGAGGGKGVKDFTIDFGGYAYTCTGPAVGSTGTQSQAFHLEWTGDGSNNANVTLKNGTITSAAGSGVRMLVQNYCNLTLDGIILDGINMGMGDYALSNNCGSVTIKDTAIIAPTGGVAFDACDYASYTGVTVTVEGNSNIQGPVEVVNHNGAENNAHLVLKGGTFAEDTVSTSYQGATAPLSDYLANGYKLTGSGPCVVSAKAGMEADASASGGSVSATVTGTWTGTESPEEDNVESSNSAITINVKTDEEDITSTAVTIDSATLKSVQESTVSTVAISTNVGTLTVDKQAWSAITDNADGSSVTLSIKKDTSNGLVYTLTAEDKDGNPVFAESGANGSITVKVDYTGTDGNTPAVFYLADDGLPEKLESTFKDGKLSWSVSHFSKYLIREGDSAISYQATGGQVQFTNDFSTALENVNAGGKITVYEDVTDTLGAVIKISGAVIINGSGKISVTAPTGSTTHCFDILKDGSLTLENVTLDITGTQNATYNHGGYGIDINHGGKLILDGATVNFKELEAATCSSRPSGTDTAVTTGTIELKNGSTITANTIDGNFSNGGIWTVDGASSISIDGCGSHGLSADAVTVGADSSISVSNTGYRGISINDTYLPNDVTSALTIKAGGTVTVTNCGAVDAENSPRPAVYLANSADKAAALVVKEGATLNVTATDTENGKNDRILLSSATGVQNTLAGTIIGNIVNGSNETIVAVIDGGSGYTTLDAAVEAATTSGQTVRILTTDKLTLTKAIKEGVTLVIANGQTVTVDLATMSTNVQNMKGTISVEAGGKLSVQKGADTFINLIGDDTYNLKLNDGKIDVSLAQLASKKIIGISFVGAKAEVPAEKYWTLTMDLGSLGSAKMNVTLDANSELSVSGQLRIANGSTLTNNGKLTVNNGGLLRVGSDGKITGAINNSGTVTLHKEGNNQANVSSITLTSGGEVYSEFDAASKIGPSGNVSTATGSFTVTGVESGTPSAPVTFGYKYTYYTPTTGGGGGGGGVTTYSVTLPTDVANGELSVSPKNAAKNTTVTLTITPDEGYELATLTVTDKNGKTVELTKKSDTQYTFKMPASNVSIKATFAPVETPPATLPFTDVDGHWALDAITYVYENGMMNGTSPTTFSPESQLTRGMIVTILYRLEDEPAVSDSTFSDVDGDMYYADPIAWAADNGIVTGFPDGTFGPETSITREQLATILYRYADYLDCDMTPAADLSGYTDAGTISSYAQQAMAWANAEGLITGVTETTLKPTGTATRAQVATILMRFCENVIK